ncbi:hypothetical protein HW555_009449, partial [Spodoptera exigua]
MLWFNSLEVRRSYFLMIMSCKTLRGESDCPEIVGQVNVRHANYPLVRVLTMLNSLLMSAPDCDLFAMRWIDLCRECLRYCKRMDD